MGTVGLRELRQNASDLLRRVEGGETITITVSGRPSAQLTPVHPNQWCTWDEIDELFRGPADPDWSAQRDLLDNAFTDPWTRQ